MKKEEIYKLEIRNLINECEQADNDFRKGNKNHKCKSWKEYTKGRWFCEHLIKHRRKKTQHKFMRALIENQPTEELKELARKLVLRK